MSAPLARLLNVENLIENLTLEISRLKDITSRQNAFIRELYDLKSTAVSKAELHAAVFAMRSIGDSGNRGRAERSDSFANPIEASVNNSELERIGITNNHIRSFDCNE